MHILILHDRSENMRLYINGALHMNLATGISTDDATGSPIDVMKSADGAVYAIAYWDLPSNPFPGAATNAAVMGAIAAERFARLNGTWPTKAGTYAPVTASRSVAASLDRYISSTERRIFTVGPNWIRTVERKDLSNVTVAGILIEPQSENEITNSSDFSGWTATRAAVSSNVAGVTAPDGTVTADGIVGSAATNTHSISNSLGHDTGLQVFSFWARLGAKTWAYCNIPHVANANAYFNLNTGAVGTVGAGCRAYCEPWGGGGWARCEVAYAGAAAPHDHDIYPAVADGNHTYLGDASTVDIYVWGAQHEDGIERATSYIPTAAAAVTRTKDQLQYSATAAGGNVAAGTGAIEAIVLIPAQNKPVAGAIACVSNAGTATQKFQIDVLASDKAHCTSVVSSVQASITNVADVADGYRHKIMGQWATNNVRCYVDSIEASLRDTTCTIAATMTVLDFGQDSAAANQIGAVISDLRVYRKPLKS
jgi:hypothetical protein